jgi:hypothetical protein
MKFKTVVVSAAENAGKTNVQDKNGMPFGAVPHVHIDDKTVLLVNDMTQKLGGKDCNQLYGVVTGTQDKPLITYLSTWPTPAFVHTGDLKDN